MRRATAADTAAVNEWAGGDFSYFLDNPLNVCLLEGNGGALFAWRGPGIYEVHVFFEQRGKAVLDLSRRMLGHMREEHGAKLFWAAVPIESRHVIMFTRLMGWKSQGLSEQPHGWCELFIGE